MKKLVEEVQDEGLVKLMGERVTFYCVNFIYTGKLVGVNDKYVLLTDAYIVYETGPHGEKNWKDAQRLPHDLYVQLSAVESFMVFK